MLDGLSVKQAEALTTRGVSGDALLNAADLAKEILAVGSEITDDGKVVYDVKAAEKAKAEVVTTDGSNSAKTGENTAVTNTNGDNMSVSEEKRDYSFVGDRSKQKSAVVPYRNKK